MTTLNRAMVNLLMGGLIILGISGCNEHSYDSAITPAPGTHAEPIDTALKQVSFHIKVPSYFPKSVTSSYAMARPEPAHPKVFRVTLYYLNKDTNEVITEEVVNLESATAVGAPTKRLSNGLTVTMNNPFDWHWTDQGVTYDLSAAKKSESGKITTPSFPTEEMEQIVTSMK